MDVSSEALRITPPCGAALRYCAGQGADALSSRRPQRPVRIAQQLAREENEIGLTAADGEVRPGPKIIPTAPADTPVARRICAANAVWYPGPSGIRAVATFPPEEQSITSTPSGASCRTSSIACSTSRGLRSSRSPKQRQLFRPDPPDRVTTSRGRRIRFSSEPP